MINVNWKLAPGPFDFQRILCKKESEEVCMVIWTIFDSFAIPYLIKQLVSKIHLRIEVVLNSLQTHKELELELAWN